MIHVDSIHIDVYNSVAQIAASVFGWLTQGGGFILGKNSRTLGGPYIGWVGGPYIWRGVYMLSDIPCGLKLIWVISTCLKESEIVETVCDHIGRNLIDHTGNNEINALIQIRSW